MDSREIHLVGDGLTATGFRLAGMKSHILTEKNVEQVFNELKDKKAAVIMTQHASQLFGERLEKIKAKSMVIVIPEKQGEKYDSMKRIIKDTVGFDLKA